MKKIINFLRKIGLLHIGSGDYMTGEFDDRKNIKQSKSKIKTKKSAILTILIIVSILFLLLTLILIDLSFWFFVILIVWIWFIFSVKKLISLNLFIFKRFIITFFLIFSISIIFILIAPNDNKQSKNNNSTSTECAAKHLSKKIEKTITAEIVNKDDIAKKSTKSNYSLQELDNLSYGFTVTNNEKDEYILSQICQKNKKVSVIHLNKNEGVLYEKKDKTAVSSSRGNYTNFSNIQNDNSLYRTIKEAGDYTLYIYSSTDGEKWRIDKKKNFKVK